MIRNCSEVKLTLKQTQNNYKCPAPPDRPQLDPANPQVLMSSAAPQPGPWHSFSFNYNKIIIEEKGFRGSGLIYGLS